MLEIWLRERRVRLRALVMLETWLRESEVCRVTRFLISSRKLYRSITLPLSTLITL